MLLDISLKLLLHIAVVSGQVQRLLFLTTLASAPPGVLLLVEFFRKLGHVSLELDARFDLCGQGAEDFSLGIPFGAVVDAFLHRLDYAFHFRLESVRPTEQQLLRILDFLLGLLLVCDSVKNAFLSSQALLLLLLYALNDLGYLVDFASHLHILVFLLQLNILETLDKLLEGLLESVDLPSDRLLCLMCLNYLRVYSLEPFSHVWVDDRLFELDASRFVPLRLEFCLDDLLADLFVVSYCFSHVEQFNTERIEHLLNLLLMWQ